MENFLFQGVIYLKNGYNFTKKSLSFLVKILSCMSFISSLFKISPNMPKHVYVKNKIIGIAIYTAIIKKSIKAICSTMEPPRLATPVLPEALFPARHYYTYQSYYSDCLLRQQSYP